MHMQDLGQWPPQSLKTANMRFTSILVPSQIDTSIETQTRTCALASSEKEYAFFGNANDAGSIIGTENVARPVEGVDYDAGSMVGTGNGAGPTEGIDLNKTPAQKSKRKKHRPKVLKEEKPSRTPKATTPKPSQGKEEKPSGKQKYVRKKTSADQPPPEQAADSNRRAELKPVRRRFNFVGQYNQDNALPGTQAQMTEIFTDPNDYQPSVSSINQRDVQSWSACHAGSITSSMYSSALQMSNTQLVPAHNTQKGILIDFNSSSMSPIQNEHTNFVDNPSKFFHSDLRETLEANPLLELHDGMPHKNVPDLNSSISLLQSMSTDFAEYFLSSSQASLRQAQMANQMLNGHGMPENPITQHLERACTNEAVIADQMLNSYIWTKNKTLPITIEGNSVMGNLKKFVTKDDYLRINTSPSMYTGEPLGLHDSHDSSDVHAKDTRGAHNASNGAQTLLDANFGHQYNVLAPVNACHPTTSEASYSPESYKRMRLNNHCYSSNGVVHNSSTMSAHLSNNQNRNMAAAVNSNMTLADVQRLIAREKSRAAQKMVSFASAKNSVSKISEMDQQHNRATMRDGAYRDPSEGPEKPFRLIPEEFMHLSNNSKSLQRENVVERIGGNELQSLGGNNATWSDIPAELHKPSISPQDDTQNSVIAPDELSKSIVGEHFRCLTTQKTTPSTSNGTIRVDSRQLGISVEVIKAHNNPKNPSTGNDVLRTKNHLLEVSPETSATQPSEKRKAGRPRKEVKPGEKPKPRGRPRKQKIVCEVLASKDCHTNPLENEVMSCVSGPLAVGALHARAINERVLESMSGAIEPQIDPLDLIIQKITLLDINKSDDIGTPEPHGALVPYKGEFGTVVPFEGTVKRKRSRAKVDLDPVTALMWKLLMGPDMSDGTETMDKDKEKWLDEERKIFQGRVESFIARMHLVQGDRRFSPWKGSVVDSVVGVFLTQNVSDHLSSSAFMALASKFPIKPEVPEKSAAEVFHTTSEENGCASSIFGEAVKLQGEILVEEPSNAAGSLIRAEEKEGSNSTDLFEGSSGDGLYNEAGVYPTSYMKLPAILQQCSPVAAQTGSFVEAEGGPLEAVVSSQNSAVCCWSSPDYLFHINGHMRYSTLQKLREEDFVHINTHIGVSSSTTDTELLPMQEIKSKYNEMIGSLEYHEVPNPLHNELHHLRRKHDPLCTYVNHRQNEPVHLPDIVYGSDPGRASYTGLNSVDYSDSTQNETGLHHPSSAPGVSSTTEAKTGDSSSSLLDGIDRSLSQDKSHFPSVPAHGADLVSPIVGTYFQPSNSEMVSFARSSCEISHSRNESEATFVKQTVHSNLQAECTTKSKQIGTNKFQSECGQPSGNVGIQTTDIPNGHSSNLCRNQKENSKIRERIASDLTENSKDAKKPSPEAHIDGPKAKKPRVGTGKKRTYDWDNLRKEVISNHRDKERGLNAKDSIDWETIRQADAKEISETIRERGMNNMLAERIKDFLNRLVRDHGSIDLEWLRYVEPDKAKDYLLSIRGLGLKSVECVRLLTLHHMAFPVDTNVGRICVRLGWVPLQPLPESLQLHLLELYPMLENIQKYLWPRLCKLDQQTLYELHYQMITFGKCKACSPWT